MSADRPKVNRHGLHINTTTQKGNIGEAKQLAQRIHKAAKIFTKEAPLKLVKLLISRLEKYGPIRKNMLYMNCLDHLLPETSEEQIDQCDINDLNTLVHISKYSLDSSREQPYQQDLLDAMRFALQIRNQKQNSLNINEHFKKSPLLAISYLMLYEDDQEKILKMLNDDTLNKLHNEAYKDTLENEVSSETQMVDKPKILLLQLRIDNALYQRTSIRLNDLGDDHEDDHEPVFDEIPLTPTERKSDIECYHVVKINNLGTPENNEEDDILKSTLDEAIKTIQDPNVKEHFKAAAAAIEQIKNVHLAVYSEALTKTTHLIQGMITPQDYCNFVNKQVNRNPSPLWKAAARLMLVAGFALAILSGLSAGSVIASGAALGLGIGSAAAFSLSATFFAKSRGGRGETSEGERMKEAATALLRSTSGPS